MFDSVFWSAGQNDIKTHITTLYKQILRSTGLILLPNTLLLKFMTIYYNLPDSLRKKMSHLYYINLQQS